MTATYKGKQLGQNELLFLEMSGGNVTRVHHRPERDVLDRVFSD